MIIYYNSNSDWKNSDGGYVVYLKKCALKINLVLIINIFHVNNLHIKRNKLQKQIIIIIIFFDNIFQFYLIGILNYILLFSENPINI